MHQRKRDIAASVRQRLLNHAHHTAEPFDLMLTRYALERLLYRLGQSEWRNTFLLTMECLCAQKSTMDKEKYVE